MVNVSRSLFETRRDQVFPKLDPQEIDRVRRFGDLGSYAAGERLMTAGQVLLVCRRPQRHCQRH